MVEDPPEPPLSIEATTPPSRAAATPPPPLDLLEDDDDDDEDDDDDDDDELPLLLWDFPTLFSSSAEAGAAVAVAVAVARTTAMLVSARNRGDRRITAGTAAIVAPAANERPTHECCACVLSATPHVHALDVNGSLH